MADVFISYARGTAAQAQAAAHALRGLGYTVWLDDELPAHRTYGRVIEEELEAASATLVLWSAEAVASEWVLSEANRAREESKLVQVMLDPVRLPMPFDQIQCPDLTGWSGELDAPGWRRATASIAVLLGRKPPAPSSSATAPLAPSAEGERRHLTFLSCSILRGGTSTPDPEEWRAVVRRFAVQAEAAIGKLGGHAGKAGDRIEAYFGYPEALEDAAERAVRAGLAIVEAAPALAERVAREQALSISLRVGVHAGMVVVAPGAGQPEVYGDAAKIAAETADAGEPSRVTVTGAVRDLVEDLFETEAAGGAAGVLDLFSIVREAPESRRAAAPVRTPFVGREEEMQLLAGRWRRAREGEGQAALVVGEPGIGKSRVVEEFRARIAADPHLWLHSAASPLFANTPFHAVRQLFERALSRGEPEAAADWSSRLEEALAATSLNLAEAVPLMAEMLGAPIPERYPPLNLSPDQRRRRLLGVMAEWVFGLAERQPLVIAVEDLQWLDPSSLELFESLVEQAASAPVMLLATARPEFRPAWPVRSHEAQITLGRLSARETRDLVAGVASGSELPEEVLRAVIQRTDGVPLFAEELTRLVGERASGAGEIPATLLDSLTARLDRLGPARDVAQVAAVIGREFSYALLAAVSGLAEEALQTHLAALVKAGVVQARGAPPQAAYQFKHALVQDAAYEALLKSARREIHARVAQAIADGFPALAESHPELMALHWTRAGEAERAIAAWKAAGDAAYARRAFREAEAAYRQGLEVVVAGEEGPERDARELELSSALSRVLQFTKGYASPETVEAAGRARTLAERAGTLSQLIREDARIWRAVITSGDFVAAAGLADRILELTRGQGENPARMLFALNAQVQTRFYTGDLEGVESHFEKLSPLLDTVGERQAPGNNIVAIGVASLTAWAIGREEVARARIERALAFAGRSKDPYDMAMALHFLANLCTLQRDVERTEAVASQLLSLAKENGFTYVVSLAMAPLGWARAHKGAAAESVSSMRSALAEQVASGARIAITNWLNRIAEAELLAGAVTNARATIEEALTANPDERVFRPESLRLRGLVRREAGDVDGAETDFRAAAALADAIGAKAWALRAGVSLAQSLLSRGETDGGRALLQDLLQVHAAATASRDLKEARGLLEGPAGASRELAR